MVFGRRCVALACLLVVAGCSKDPAGGTKAEKDIGPLARAFAAIRQPAPAPGEPACFPGIDPCGTASAQLQARETRPARPVTPIASASAAPAAAADSEKDASNAFTVMADAEDFQLVSEMVNVLNGKGLRVMPVVGLSAARHLDDIAHHGIDFAVVPANVLEARSGAETRTDERIRYVARLYDEELHVLARLNISDLRQLDGRRVNVGARGSGAETAARAVFASLGIAPVLTNHDDAYAQQKLREGDLDAAIFLTARPAKIVTEVEPEDRLHLVGVPHDLAASRSYRPALLLASDYPGLVEPAAPVQTLTVPNVLAVLDAPQRSARSKRLTEFVRAFYARIGQLRQLDRPSRWQDIDPAAEVPGWTRYRPAENLLKVRTAARATGPAPRAESVASAAEVRPSGPLSAQ